MSIHARRRAAAYVAATCVAISTLAACTASGDQSKGDASTLRVSFASAPATIDPADGCTGENRQFTYSLYTRLVAFGSAEGPHGTTRIDPTTVAPSLAKEWSTSDDGTTYTFTLNEGWKFPSGEAMDAEAVKYSLDRALDTKGCAWSILNDLYTDPDLIKSIEAPDATTVVITLAKPDPQLLSALADTSGSIVDPSLVEANGGIVKDQANTWMASHSAGGGPFLLKSYEPGTSAVLEANPTFGGKPPASSRIEVSWTTSASTQLLNLQNGSTDIALGLSGAALNSLSASDDARVVSYEDTQSMVMTMPNGKAPWTNPKVREAVVKAIPTQKIIDNVIYGYGKAYYGPIPPSLPGYSEQYGQPVQQDLEAARQLIAESDLATPIKVTLDVLAGDQSQKSIATVVQSSLKEIGVDVTVNTLTSSAWNDAVYNHKSQAALRYDGPAIANAGYYLQYDESCKYVDSYNVGAICIDANTPLLEQARTTNDEAERDQLYAQLTQNWVTAYPRVVLYMSLTPVVLSPSVGEFYFSSSYDMSTWARS
ncbi:ABC transporter substrate-binding protein [Pedococcus sp. P5_B7]